jgi:hypothetical protein
VVTLVCRRPTAGECYFTQSGVNEDDVLNRLSGALQNGTWQRIFSQANPDAIRANIPQWRGTENYDRYINTHIVAVQFEQL